jgi:hypothetical protein
VGIYFEPRPILKLAFIGTERNFELSIGMVDFEEEFLVPDIRAEFLPELAVERAFERLLLVSFPPRKFPEAGQKAGGRPFLDQVLPGLSYDAHNGIDFFKAALFRQWNDFLLPLLISQTKALPRAKEAERIFRPADQGSELHQGLIKIAWFRFWQK